MPAHDVRSSITEVAPETPEIQLSKLFFRSRVGPTSSYPAR